MRAKKLLKIGVLSIAILLVTLVLAFMTLVYNPFEGTLPALRTAVPRNLDFYVGKRNLRDDFDRFPQPKFWFDVEQSRAFAMLRQTKFVRREAERQVKAALAELDRVQAQLRQIPLLHINILSDMIGRDVAVAGRFDPSGRAQWCAYSRVSWKISAGVGLLHYDAVRSALGGMTVTEDGGIFEIVPAGRAPIYLTRVLDVVIVGNSKQLVELSRDLGNGTSTKDSLGSSADYQDELVGQLNDWRDLTGDPGNALEFMLNLERIRKLNPRLDNWPGADADIGIEGRLFKSFANISSMRRLWGSVVFHALRDEETYDGRIVTSLLRFVMNRKELSGFQGRFLSERQGSVQEWLKPMLLLVPTTAAGVAIIRVPATAFVLELIQSLDPEYRQMIDEGLRGAGEQAGLRGFANRLALALQPFVGVIIRNNQFRAMSGAKINVAIPSPAPAYALVFQVTKPKLVQAAIKMLQDNYRSFPKMGKSYTLTTGHGDMKILEFESALIEGTGSVAILDGSVHLGGYLLFGNQGQLLSEIVRARYGDGQTRSLFSEPLTQRVLDQTAPNLSGFFYFNGEQIRSIIARYQSMASDRVNSSVPPAAWAMSVRETCRQTVFKREYSTRYRSRDQLSGRERRQFEDKVDQEVDALWRRERSKFGQTAVEGYSQLLSYLECLDRAFMTMRVGGNQLSFDGRAYLKFQ